MQFSYYNGLYKVRKILNYNCFGYDLNSGGDPRSVVRHFDYGDLAIAAQLQSN